MIHCLNPYVLTTEIQGFMSPEYAIEGRFSKESDIFSFGVLLLEIVSGKKNTSFHDDDSMTLLGFVSTFNLPFLKLQISFLSSKVQS